MSRFEELLFKLKDHPEQSLDEVIKHKTRLAMATNDTYIGIYVFYPSADISHYHKYQELHYKQRLKSDTFARNIWGVTNPELYEIWYDHLYAEKGEINDEYKRIYNIIESDIPKTKKVKRKKKYGLLTCEDIIKLGAFNYTEPHKNHFKVTGYETNVGDISIKDLYRLYREYTYNPRDYRWEKYYLQWKELINKLNMQFKLTTDDIEKDKIRQTMLELGWITGVDINKHKISIKNNMVPIIDVSKFDTEDMKFESEENWIYFVTIATSSVDPSKVELFMTIDFNRLVYIDKDEDIIKYVNINDLRGEITVYGYKVDPDEYNALCYSIGNIRRGSSVPNNLDYSILHDMSIEYINNLKHKIVKSIDNNMVFPTPQEIFKLGKFDGVDDLRDQLPKIRTTAQAIEKWNINIGNSKEIINTFNSPNFKILDLIKLKPVVEHCEVFSNLIESYLDLGYTMKKYTDKIKLANKVSNNINERIKSKSVLEQHKAKLYSTLSYYLESGNTVGTYVMLQEQLNHLNTNPNSSEEELILENRILEVMSDLSNKTGVNNDKLITEINEFYNFPSLEFDITCTYNPR